MTSERLWRFIWVLLIIVLLMTATIYFSTDKNVGWQQVSAQGLKSKIQHGLAQIHWQWQSEGRPGRIKYQPQNMAQAVVIKLNKRGLPIIESNNNGCNTFLSWFVDADTFNLNKKVTTSFMQDTAQNMNASIQQVNNSANKLICKFQYANKVFRYNLDTGVVTFS